MDEAETASLSRLNHLSLLVIHGESCIQVEKLLNHTLDQVRKDELTSIRERDRHRSLET